jgi:hypothetical protein
LTALLWAAKRLERVGKIMRGKRMKLIAVADNASLPCAVHAESAAAHEVRHVDETLQTSFISRNPVRLIGDKVFDCGSVN